MTVRERVFADVGNRFRAVMSEGSIVTMFELCSLVKGNETGGILVGEYSDDLTTAQIYEATPPPSDSRSGRDWFERGTSGLRRLLKTRWAISPRTYYLGEWHFHTANVPWPSRQDVDQMRVVAAKPAYRCETPLLALVYPIRRMFEVKLFAFPGREPLVELVLQPEFADQ